MVGQRDRVPVKRTVCTPVHPRLMPLNRPCRIVSGPGKRNLNAKKLPDCAFSTRLKPCTGDGPLYLLTSDPQAQRAATPSRSGSVNAKAEEGP